MDPGIYIQSVPAGEANAGIPISQAKKKQKKINSEKSDLEERVTALEEENLRLRLVCSLICSLIPVFIYPFPFISIAFALL